MLCLVWQTVECNSYFDLVCTHDVALLSDNAQAMGQALYSLRYTNTCTLPVRSEEYFIKTARACT